MIRARVLGLPEQASSHAHADHQMVVALDGRAEFEVEGRGGAVGRLQACLVPGSALHAFAGSRDNRMLILDLPADLRQLPAVEPLLRLFEQPRYLPLAGSLQGLLQFTSRQLELHAQAESPMLWHLSAALLHGLHDELFHAPQANHGRLDLLRLEQFVRANLERPLDVAELAAQQCLSPSHLHACFRREAGTTPHQFVLRLRVEEACRLLAETRLPLSEVAARCGFSSQSAMTHVLVRHTGRRPRQWRHAVA